MPMFVELSSAARDVAVQLFIRGPTWDGDVVSKSGRNELVEHALAEHRNGWAYLTRSGVEFMISDQVRDIVRNWADQRCYKKIIGA